MKKMFIIALIAMVAIPFAIMASEITANGSHAIDVQQLRKELVYSANHKLLGSAGIGSATSYLTVTGTPVAVVENEFVTLTATNTISFSSPVTTVGNSKFCLFAIGVQADGSYVTKQSPIETYENDLVLPLFDAGTTLIGKLEIATDADGSFVPNTTHVAVSTASITATITNMSGLPLSLDVKQR